MSQNSKKLYDYLNKDTEYEFGTFDNFNEQLKNPEIAEKLYDYLSKDTEYKLNLVLVY